MSVNSLFYFFFLIVLYLGYYVLCPLKYRWCVLLLGSVFFYVTACTEAPYFILVTGICVWMAGLLMQRFEKKQQKKLVLSAGIVLTLGILMVLKYGGFFVGLVNRAGTFVHVQLPIPKFLVPLGISYYTLVAIGYLMDVYKGKTKAEANFFKLMLFLAFFPQISQGPISRHKQLEPQLMEGHRWDYENLSAGCQRMLWGLFKKMVIADRMQPMMQTIFDHYTEYSGLVCFLGCVYMTVWMYADFSGYMDIVCGTAKMFGIQLEENFKRPFFSKNLAEYWRRWHITLCSWFRDYLFYPLAVSKPAVKFGKFGRKWCGVRVGKLFPSLFALSFVWFSTGLWHAASFRYVLWGVANGVVIMGAMVLEPYFRKIKEKLHIQEKSKAWEVFCMIRTFLLVSLLKVFPGAVSTRAMFGITARIFTDFHLPESFLGFFPGLQMEDVIILTLALLVVFFVDLYEEKASFFQALGKKPVVVRWLCYAVLLTVILCLGEFGLDMKGGFAYAQY